VAVLGLPDDDLGEVLGAVVYPVPGASLSPADVEAFARAHLARFEVPTRWMFLAEPLPTTAAGKVDKVGLRVRFAAEAG
jgi:acyl-CoA synthetase (AMP-forming)/AMP-acid ligase II